MAGGPAALRPARPGQCQSVVCYASCRIRPDEGVTTQRIYSRSPFTKLGLASWGGARLRRGAAPQTDERGLVQGC